MRLGTQLLAAVAVALAAPAAARPMPPLESLATTPAERALLPRLAALDAGKSPDERLGSADSLLAELPRPTLLRGAVQMARSPLLSMLGRDEEAIAAALEAVRLLPGYSGPQVNAALIQAYSDHPREAVDHLVAASAIDLELIARLSEYDVNGLVERLDQHDEREKLATLADLLARVGWKQAPDTSSSLALARIEARLDAGDTDAAAALVGEVIEPAAFSSLLTEKKFSALRPAAIAFAGPRLERLWPRYLALAQAQWQANAHERVRRVYADALISAGHDRSLIATFAPLFDGAISPDDHSFLFAAVPVARAYARLGQWERGYDLLARVAAAFDEDVANRLNVTAARAILLEEQGRLDEAAAAFDTLIADSQRWAGTVGEHNLTAMHSHLACVLEQLGRGADAAASWRYLRQRQAVDPGPIAEALLCRDDIGGAREVLIAALADETARETALGLIQPSGRGPLPSDYSRRHRERWDRLRADPELRAAASRYGELLTERLNAAAPPDPMLGRETPAP